MKEVLVTSAIGFLGGEFVKRLLDDACNSPVASVRGNSTSAMSM